MKTEKPVRVMVRPKDYAYLKQISDQSMVSIPAVISLILAGVRTTGVSFGGIDKAAPPVKPIAKPALAINQRKLTPEQATLKAQQDAEYDRHWGHLNAKSVELSPPPLKEPSLRDAYIASLNPAVVQEFLDLPVEDQEKEAQKWWEDNQDIDFGD